MRIDAQSRELEGEEMEELWEDAMEEHKYLVKITKKEGPKVMFSPEPQDLQKIKGSYVIHCDRVQEQWPSRHLFTLDIGRTGAPRQPKIVAGVLKLS